MAVLKHDVGEPGGIELFVLFLRVLKNNHGDMVLEDRNFCAEAPGCVPVAFRTGEGAVDFLMDPGIPEFYGLCHDFPLIALVNGKYGEDHRAPERVGNNNHRQIPFP